MDLANELLSTLIKRFENCKDLGDKALVQAALEDLLWRPDAESNSVAIIIQHLHGNMLSRFTDFLTTDGDKPWRQRDAEFEPQDGHTKESLIDRWEKGWACTFDAISPLTAEDLTRIITIRGAELTVIDALLRQLGHYNYHVGQIVYILRHRLGDNWQTLSIARGQSGDYKPTARD